jgi:hypothetical protein
MLQLHVAGMHGVPLAHCGPSTTNEGSGMSFGSQDAAAQLVNVTFVQRRDSRPFAGTLMLTAAAMPGCWRSGTRP